MENKLTIEHLAPYLPYGLKVTFRGEEEIKFDLVGIVLSTDPLQVISDDGYFGHAPVEKCLPILRPLSQLTQEIEHNGERFVPFERIASIESPNITGANKKIHSITRFNRGVSFSSRQKGVSYKYEGVTVEITHFNGAVFHKRVIDGNDSWVFSYFHNYPDIIRGLHEWHFDVFGLIDSGLAIEEGGQG